MLELSDEGLDMPGPPLNAKSSTNNAGAKWWEGLDMPGPPLNAKSSTNNAGVKWWEVLDMPGPPLNAKSSTNNAGVKWWEVLDMPVSCEYCFEIAPALLFWNSIILLQKLWC